MHVSAERTSVAKKKTSESRKFASMTRVDPDALERARLAASLMGMSTAEWLTAAILEVAERDIQREAAKLVAGSPAEPKAKPKAARS